jgi:4-hydroxy-3-polyprenylbenzoate decarboxylase
MAIDDVREFIEICEKTGDVKRVKEEIDWNLEVGAIIRRSNETEGPAPFFEKIKGYPEGYRIFGAPIATYRRIAIALGLDPDKVDFKELLKVYNERRKKPIKPNLVKDGPCKENIHLGDEVDLLEFPAPLLHYGDGGRYISTFHIIATKDPDSSWINWGMYRQMIHTKNTLGGIIIPFQHIGRMYFEKYEPRNIPMEFATAIGIDPITGLVGTSTIAEGVSEMDIIGGLREEPLNVVKCETVDLFVPAAAEIVIEGVVMPYEREDEGPFGEYTGYRTSPRMPRPVYKVKAITHRNAPIITSSCMGTATDDCDAGMGLSLSSDLWEDLIRAGLPVTGIYIPPEGCLTLVVVSTTVPYHGVAERIAGCIWANKNAIFLNKIIVVDDDVNPTDMREVIHAWVTKNHPVRGTLVVPNFTGHPLVPFCTEEERRAGKGSAVLYDCTWPPHEAGALTKASLRDMYPKEVQEKILRIWG